jgi:hypothetical protein
MITSFGKLLTKSHLICWLVALHQSHLLYGSSAPIACVGKSPITSVAWVLCTNHTCWMGALHQSHLLAKSSSSAPITSIAWVLCINHICCLDAMHQSHLLPGCYAPITSVGYIAPSQVSSVGWYLCCAPPGLW